MGNSASPISQDELRDLRKKFDVDGSGDIGPLEAKKLAEAIRIREGIPQPLPDKQIDDLFRKLDADSSGKLSPDEFERTYILIRQLRDDRIASSKAQKDVVAKSAPKQAQPKAKPADQARGSPKAKADGKAKAKAKTKNASSVQAKAKPKGKPKAKPKAGLDSHLTDAEAWDRAIEAHKQASGASASKADLKDWRRVTAVDHDPTLSESDLDSEQSVESISGVIPRWWNPAGRDERYKVARDPAVGMYWRRLEQLRPRIHALRPKQSEADAARAAAVKRAVEVDAIKKAALPPEFHMDWLTDASFPNLIDLDIYEQYPKPYFATQRGKWL